MRVTRITNRGRIAPRPRLPSIDSGRKSWSSASIVSTIDTQSPEPNLTEQTTQRLQDVAPTSSVKKKAIVGATVAVTLCVIAGVILGSVLPSVLKQSTPAVTSTTIVMHTNSSAGTSPSTSTTAITSTITSATTATVTTITTTTIK